MTPLDRLAEVVELAEWADGWRDVAEALLDVARAAALAREHNHHEGWRGKCVCNTCKALAALDSAITKALEES